MNCDLEIYSFSETCSSYPSKEHKPKPGIDSQGDAISTHGLDVQQEEPSLLKKLLIQNKEDESSLSQKQNMLTTSKNISSNPTPTFSFPPALLAANPGLANAAPGSIVVVASPRAIPNTTGQSVGTNTANQQLLHVFMVSDEDNQSKTQGTTQNNISPMKGEKEKSVSNANRRLARDSPR